MRRAQQYLASAVLFLPILGCDSAVEPNEPPVDQEKRESIVVLPPVTEYTGRGSEYTREVRHVRVFTPFGESPGSTIGKVEAFDTKTGTTPEIDLNGATVGQGGATSFLGGGMKGGWLSQLWSDWIRPILFWYAGALVVSAVLMFIPATSVFGKTMLRILLSPVPVVGTAVENRIASLQVGTARKQFSQVVAGVRDYVTDHPDQKTALYSALSASQDADTQKAVREAKASPG